jgi:hypothetical protein
MKIDFFNQTAMMLVVDIDEGNMMGPNNFKVAHRMSTENFFKCFYQWQDTVGNVLHTLK